MPSVLYTPMATDDGPDGQHRRSSQIPRSLRCLFSLCYPDEDDLDGPHNPANTSSRPFDPPVQVEHETRGAGEPLRTSANASAGMQNEAIIMQPSTSQRHEKPLTHSSAMHGHPPGPSGASISLRQHRDSAGDLTRQAPSPSPHNTDPLGQILLRQSSSGARKNMNQATSSSDLTATVRSSKQQHSGTSGHRRIGSSGLERASSAENLNEMEQPASLSSANVLNRINMHGHRRNTSKASIKGSSAGNMKEMGLGPGVSRAPSPRLLVPQEEDDDFCPTCLENYNEENPKIFTECGHHFHLPCLYEWSNIKPTCPMCSMPMRW